MKNNPTEYWKGLEELHHEEEFEKQINNEFAEKLPIGKVINDDDLGLTSNRRDFLKFMGFGIGAATLAACSHSPVRKAVPFVNKPVDVDAGIPELYASTCSGCNANCSILVKTRDGRPIKIEGNDESPFNKGGVCAVGQSTVLSLYDSGRLSHPVKGGKASDWKTIDADVMAALKSATGVRVLTGTINSPTTQAVIDDFCKKYNAKHIQYDASSVYALREAHNASFGKTVTPNYMIDKAKVLVSFGADFLGTWISPVEYTKAYSASRKSTLKKEDFLYHVQFESNLSLTGSNADMRVTLSPSQYGQALVRLHNLIAGYAGASAAGNSSLELGGNSIEHTAKALWKSKGKALVICGSNDVNHQVLVASINSMLDSYGNTIDIDNPSYQNMGNDKDMIGLVAEMNAGKVDVLILHDVNPVYTYPDQKAFVSGWGKVKTTVNLATRLDETADKSTHVAPNSHGLESWGDAMPKAGYISLIQPTISTIFSTRQTEESLLTWMETPMAYDEYLKKNWKKTYYNTKDSFDDYWEKCLEMGFITTETSTAGSHAFKGDASAAATEALKTTSGKGLEIVTYEKLSIKDGKNANNPWLQELPDPVSKVSWDNYAAMSPKLAEEKGLKNEDVVEITCNGTTVKLPVLSQPGVRYGIIAIALGYGRSMNETAGKVCNGIGANAYHFASVSGDCISYQGASAEMKKTGDTYDLALTQTHHHMEGRDLVRETTHSDLEKGVYKEHWETEYKGHQVISMWQDYRYPGHKWGMAIDLNACTGCNACVVSCQAENNVPVVGKDEVRRRREMHWIRIDRYYSFVDTDGKLHDDFKDIDKNAAKFGNYENVKVVFQPLMCQHCDNAPCESVCPVNATNHSSDGLNQQAYNRCVGTRYCANNCPYKVRRFNWFNYAINGKFKDYTLSPDLERMVLNPDVTVRTRGVMEKCTMCVQRIQVGKLTAKKEERPIKDGEIRTACMQGCPANAIVFGDMNDPNSEISKLIKNERKYKILDNELNTRPGVSYLAKIRVNPKEIV